MLLAAPLVLLLLTSQADDADFVEEPDAAELPSQTMVVGASRHRQTLSQAPASVTVISGEEIKRFGWRTLSEVLSNVRGLYTGTDRNYAYAGVRGFARAGDYNSRVLLLVNGHTMNDAPFLGALIGREFGIDLDLVERIEVIRGPGSSLYGTSAVLAVINVVTLTGPDPRQLDGAGVGAAVEADSTQRVQAAARVDRFISNVRVLASASYDQSAGQAFSYPELGLSGRTDPSSDSDRPINLFSQIQAGPFSLQAGLNTFEKHVPTASFEVLPEAGLRTHDLRAFVDGRSDVELSDEVTLSGRLYYNRSSYHGYYPYAPEDGGETEDDAQGSWGGLELYVDSQPFSFLRLIAGAQVERYFSVTLSASADGEPSFAHERSYWHLAGFAEAELQPFESLRLIAGLRLDRYDVFDAEISPRLAAVITPLPGSTLKLVYGTAFKAPNAYERYYEDDSQVASPELAPEYLSHYEAIAEQELFEGQGLLTLTLFRYQMDGLISLALTPDAGQLVYANMDRATTTGAELELSAHLPFFGMRGEISYSFSDARDGSSHTRLSNSPLHLAQGRLLLPLFAQRANLALAARYVGERPGTLDRDAAPQALLLDLALSADDILPGVDAAIGASNILDTRWYIPGSVEHTQTLLAQDGRVVWLRLSSAF